MSQVLVIMTCENKHQWARVGEDGPNGSINMGHCVAERALDDPTCCEVCRMPAKRFSVLRDPLPVRQDRAVQPVLF